MVNEQALLADLVEAINAWLEGNRQRNLSSLSRRSNIAYSTVRRIAQNESVPHPYTALAIAEIVMTTMQRVEFLKKHFPTIGNLMDSCYTSQMRPEANDESLRRFLRMEPHNRIFNMAATKKGTSRFGVNRLCGQSGLDALDEMLEAGVLIEKQDGSVHYTHESWAIGNIEDALEQVRQSTDHFDKQLLGTEGASLMHATGSIAKEQVPRLKEIVLKFIKDVNALTEQPEAVGDVHFFCDLLYSLYDRHEWEPKQEHL